MNGGARPLPWGGAPGFAAGTGLPPVQGNRTTAESGRAIPPRLAWKVEGGGFASIAAGAFASLTDAGRAELGLRLDRGVRSGTRVVTMVTLVVRSGAVTFDRTHEIPCKQAG